MPFGVRPYLPFLQKIVKRRDIMEEAKPRMTERVRLGLVRYNFVFTFQCWPVKKLTYNCLPYINVHFAIAKSVPTKCLTKIRREAIYTCF